MVKNAPVRHVHRPSSRVSIYSGYDLFVPPELEGSTTPWLIAVKAPKGVRRNKVFGGWSIFSRRESRQFNLSSASVPFSSGLDG